MPWVVHLQIESTWAFQCTVKSKIDNQIEQARDKHGCQHKKGATQNQQQTQNRDCDQPFPPFNHSTSLLWGEEAEAVVTRETEGEWAGNPLGENNFNQGTMGVRLGESAFAAKTIKMHGPSRHTAHHYLW